MKWVMAWPSGTLVLPLFTLHFVWLCPHATFGQNVNCWWNQADISVTHNVSIECHAGPQSYMQTCGHCHLRLNSSETTAQATVDHCSRSAAHFFALLEPQTEEIGCVLSCPEQATGICTIKKGYPPPTCLIPDDNAENDISCHWTRSHYPPDTTTFALYWEVSRDNGTKFQRHTEVGNSNTAIIKRSEYSYGNVIKVWVSARNALGFVDSDFIIFNPADIREPLPPEFHDHTSREIFWNMGKHGDEGISQEWECEVQYKNEYDLDWTEAIGTYDSSFMLDDPQPFTNYTFRVRCGFSAQGLISVMSSWASYTIEIPAAAPVGKLDVWSECEPNSDQPSCMILWKEMPKVQARSQISSYLVKVKLNNGSEYTAPGLCTQCGKVVDGGMKNISDCPHCLSCQQEQCCFLYSQFRVPIREVKDICVTATSKEGMSSPAHVALPRLARLRHEVHLKVSGENHALNVSWSAPQDSIEKIQEYVVQLKPVGLPQKLCLNWVKVDKAQNFVILKGQFWNYTAYNVSLFAVVNNCSHLLQSAVTYTVQGVPPKVVDLSVSDISSSSVNLTWQPIPLNKSRGIILKYVVGLDNHTVWDVGSDKSSFYIPKLNPGQHYEAWIYAVTAAGEGGRTSTTFTTDFYLIMFIVILLVFTIILIAGLCLCYHLWSPLTAWLKIPDPINSSFLKQKNNQFQQDWLVPNLGSLEQTLKISQVEVITVPDGSPEGEQAQPEEDREHGEDSEKELQESGRLERINSTKHQRTKGYQQMIDTSEEDTSMDNDDEEWDEPTSPSDYEKHFMPSALDV